jgi:hypothetical protein
MSYTHIPTRTENDLNSSADVNQLMENIKVISGNGEQAPEKTITELLAYVIDLQERLLEAETELSDFRPAKLFQVQHKLSGATGSGTFTAGAWRDRPLNHVAINEITGASFDSLTSKITLPAGKYEVSGVSYAFYCNANTARLYNITKDEVIIIGTAGLSYPAGGYNNSGSEIYGRFELTEETEIQLHHWCQTTRTTDGFGYRNVACIDDTDAIYADFKFWKIG